MAARLLFVLVMVLVLHAAPAHAQDPGSTTTTLTQVPSQDIIPQPNTGEEPHDAGDRGGALQLTVLALVILAIAATVTLVVRQSRRAREEPS
jgi:hypothetical protein